MRLRTGLIAAWFFFCAAARAEIVIYDLPGDDPDQVVGAVIQALNSYCATSQMECVASRLPDAQLLVEAPRTAHTQLAGVLDAIAERMELRRFAAEELAKPVTLHYWAISGSPGKPDAAQDALRPLAPVLRQLEQLSGDLGFEVQDKAALTIVLPDGEASIGQGAGLSIEHDTQRADPNTLRADVRIQYLKPRPEAAQEGYLQQTLEVDMTLRKGEYLVLGERTFRTTGDSSLSTMFFVVHWPEMP